MKRHRWYSMLSRRRFIALLTDFGHQDHYSGTVKGVIWSINPRVQIADICHGVAPQNFRQAGYLLWAAYRYFPKGTIFLSIVDPGVGTERRILVVRSAGKLFVAPANGLLDLVLADEPDAECIEVGDRAIRELALESISTTFHGRDILAPLAAHLSLGMDPERLGDKVTHSPAGDAFLSSSSGGRRALVLHVDRFGNLITNIRMGGARGAGARPKTLRLKRRTIARWAASYQEAPEKTPCLMLGSSGLVEIAVKNGNASRMLGADAGMPLKVNW